MWRILIMVVEEYTLIRVSLLNKAKLDDFKLIKESYDSVLDELIEFGEENDFKSVRIKNLTKNFEDEKNAKTKIKRETISTITG